MDDNTCRQFLQWTLPELQMRWEGYRKVRKQVCKRLGRRLQALNLPNVTAYQDYVQQHHEEWKIIDALCRVTISRFFRDKIVFSTLQSKIFPEIVARLRDRNESVIRIWSAGCAAGEEPYSLNILWQLDLKERLAEEQIGVEIIATDSDQQVLERAFKACYPYSSIKNVPDHWRERAFIESQGEYCLGAHFKQNVHFLCQDIRLQSPPGQFDIILCRNLVFTYFNEQLQRQILRRFVQCLKPRGVLIIGIHENIPHDYEDFISWSQRIGIYRRRS